MANNQSVLQNLNLDALWLGDPNITMQWTSSHPDIISEHGRYNPTGLTEDTDVTLTARSDMASFVDSLVAPLSLINAIVAYIGRKKQDEVTETLDRLEQVWKEYHVYTK